MTSPLSSSQEIPIPQRKEQLKLWIRNNPIKTKVLNVAMLILGIGLKALIPLTAPSLVARIGLVLAGSMLTIAAGITFLALDILFLPSQHDMKNHVYKEGKCQGGRLYYHEDVPILELEASDPHQAGYAQGYLCGAAIETLSCRIDLAKRLFNLKKGVIRSQTAKEFSKTIEHIKKTIPKDYYTEIQGLKEGYNAWVNEQPFWRPTKQLTEDDFILFHLMADDTHFKPHRYEKGDFSEKKIEEEENETELSIACSSIVHKNSEQNLIFARNMDWPSLGVFGTYSLIFHRYHKNNETASTIEVTIPGLIGTLTGMNEHGLCLAMNVCKSLNLTQEIQGPPAVFYNRMLLTNCKTHEDALNFIKEKNPLGAYHLTIADKTQASSFHLLQAKDKTHNIRTKPEKEPLITLNFPYPSKEPDTTPKRDLHFSNARQKIAKKFFEKNPEKVEDILKTPCIDNEMTIHSVVMDPNDLTMSAAFGNGGAGQKKRYSLNILKKKRLTRSYKN